MPPGKGVTLDSLHELLLKLNSKHDATDNRLNMIEQSLTSHLNTLTVDMNSKIAKVSEECVNRDGATNAKIDELSMIVDSLRGQIADSHERNVRNIDIIIRGIPLLEDENDDKLGEIFSKICSSIKCDLNVNSITRIFRFKRSAKAANAQVTRPQNIIVKLVNSDAKNQFMSNYYKAKSLSLNHIGIESNSRIYCNENLTVANYKLFLCAMKNKGIKLHSVFTNNGHVFYRITPDANPVKLLCANEIENFPDIITDEQANSSETRDSQHSNVNLRRRNRTIDKNGLGKASPTGKQTGNA